MAQEIKGGWAPHARWALVVAAFVSAAAMAVVACSGGGGAAAGDGGSESGSASDGGVRDSTSSQADAPGEATTKDGGTDAPETTPVEGSTPQEAGADAPAEAGIPSLVTLTVTAPPTVDGGPPGTLVPPFSPAIHDYSVRCASGVNPLLVSMTASPGADSLLVQPTASPTLPQQTLSVQVEEGAAVVAAATDGVSTVEYWVRCLPHDFPLLQWNTHPDAGAAPAGYSLIGTLLPSQGRGYAVVLDSNGVPVWFEPASQAAGSNVVDVDDVIPGAISYYSSGDPPASEFEIHQLAPLLTTYAAPANTEVDLHELRLLPNGDYLVISAPPVTEDLTGMQIPTADGGIQTLSGPQTMADCDVVEFTPGGTVVWSWSASDHFDPVADSVYPEVSPFGPVGGVTEYDPFHCNSIDVDSNNGNLLVSSRQMASIFYIDRSTGRVLWKMGGATASKDGATYVTVADSFALQHDARLQPDWAPSCGGGTGHISLFDDEVPGGAKNARGVIYDVTIAPNPGGADAGVPDGGCAGDAGATASSATVSWQFATQVPSAALGSFRIRPDGSRIIGWGLIPGVGFSEVDPSGNDLVDLLFLDGNVTYRAIPAPLSAFDLNTLRATAGLP